MVAEEAPLGQDRCGDRDRCTGWSSTRPGTSTWRFTFTHDPRPRVLRLGVDGSSDDRAAARGRLPDGLAFHDDALYIADSALGVVWRFLPSDASLTR